MTILSTQEAEQAANYRALIERMKSLGWSETVDGKVINEGIKEISENWQCALEDCISVASF